MGRLYIYLHHLVDFYGFHVGKYTGPMDGMGKDDDFESMMITSM